MLCPVLCTCISGLRLGLTLRGVHLGTSGLTDNMYSRRASMLARRAQLTLRGVHLGTSGLSLSDSRFMVIWVARQMRCSSV